MRTSREALELSRDLLLSAARYQRRQLRTDVALTVGGVSMIGLGIEQLVRGDFDLGMAAIIGGALLGGLSSSNVPYELESYNDALDKFEAANKLLEQQSSARPLS